jgi:hypothetical protein
MRICCQRGNIPFQIGNFLAERILLGFLKRQIEALYAFKVDISISTLSAKFHNKSKIIGSSMCFFITMKIEESNKGVQQRNIPDQKNVCLHQAQISICYFHPKNLHKRKHEDLGIKFGKPDTKSSSLSATQKNGHLNLLTVRFLCLPCNHVVTIDRINMKIFINFYLKFCS